jgi:tetratricopeptide (TPR) repeat protein
MQNEEVLKEVVQEGGIRKALIISVSEYATQLQPLSFCKNDGQHIYELLKSINYNVQDKHKLIGYVTYESLREAILDFFTDIDNKAEDTLLFYYSGHGLPDVDGDIYLASSEIDPDAPFRKGFSFNELTKMIQRSVSIRIVTVLDCCYSGAAKLSKGHEEDAAKLGTAAIHSKATVLEQGEGKCLLAASQAAQEAYALKEGEHSIFTYYLLEGLRGNEKSVDADGNITPYSLGNYVYRAILNLPAKKRPKQKPITKVEASGDIVLAHYPQLAKAKVDVTEDPNDLIQDAVESLKAADYNNTVEYSDKAIKINPRFAFAYNVKGQAFFGLKQYQEAFLCYEKAIELRPKYIEAINNRALALSAIGDHAKAIESFNQSIDLNSRDPLIWNYKGLAFNALGKYKEAISSFDKAINLNPKYAEAANNKDIASAKLQEIEEQRKQQEERNAKKETNPSSTGSPIIQPASIGSQLSKTKDHPINDNNKSVFKQEVSPRISHTLQSKTKEEGKSSNSIPKPNKSIISPSTSAPFSDNRQHKDSYSYDHDSYSSSTTNPKTSLKIKPKILILILAGVIGAVIIAAAVASTSTPNNGTSSPTTDSGSNATSTSSPTTAPTTDFGSNQTAAEYSNQTAAEYSNQTAAEYSNQTAAAVDFNKYSKHGITIQYPSDWSSDRDKDGSIGFYSSARNSNNGYVAAFFVNPGFSPSTSDIGDLLKKAENAYSSDEKEYPDFKVIESDANLYLAGGNPAYKLKFTYTMDGNNDQTWEDVGVLIDNKLYILRALVDTESYANYSSIIETMINSFRVS